MKARFFNPKSIAVPTGNRYMHAVSLPADATILMTSGQVGERPDGTTPADFAGQVEAVFHNLSEILAEAQMAWSDVVKMQIYLVYGAADIALLRPIRDRVMAGHVCASTLVYVPALAKPDWQVEIEITAVK
ncbi:RidA family protein [Oceanibaculum pacificum]|uniref:Enamine deaminase RidA n=1 Tax=Oceanibaculum pacificum TaxID=580166 RepID=A0A154WEY3_9PROT|nr:Rid family hydrolase [Oceanibaculum pacificum]KZD12093.1 hypothetical protein AUP43_05510 [Oceanibaculum pacificum]